MQEQEFPTYASKNISSIDAIHLFSQPGQALALFSKNGQPQLFNTQFIEYFPKTEANNNFYLTTLIYSEKRDKTKFNLKNWIKEFSQTKKTLLESEQLWLTPSYGLQAIPVYLEIKKVQLDDTEKLILTIHDKSLERQFHAHHKLMQEHFSGQFITDSNGFITQPNKAFCHYTQLNKQELSKLNYVLWLKKQVSFNVPFDQVMSSLLKQHHWRGDVQIFNEQKANFTAILSLSMLVDTKNNIEHFIGVLQDLTEIKQAQQKINTLSNFDELTGLANRNQLNKKLIECYSQDDQTKTQYSLLMIGLEGFNIINDTYGTKVGDELLVLVSNKVQQFISKQAVLLARLDGSHFAILLNTRVDDEFLARSEVSYIANQLLKEIKSKYQLDQHSLHISASIGASLFTSCKTDGQVCSSDNTASEQLINYANMALSEARKQKGDDFYFFEQSLVDTAHKHLELIEALNHSELDKEFQLYFQGQANAAGDIIAAETLIRWFHPVLGIIPPSKFIPVAEEGRQIIKIGLWVLHKAFLQAKAWQQLNPEFRMAINISPVQFHEQSFIEIIIGLVKFTRVLPTSITLELTEGVLIKNAQLAMQKIQHLVSLGFEVSIDDFGTGYSSLSYLQKLPIHELKIDRSFIAHLQENPDDDAIVESIVQLALSKKLKLVAEGVETKEQADCLIQKEPKILLQGYYFCKPMPAEEFEQKHIL